MRLDEQKLNVTVSDNLPTNRFSAKMDGKMFSLLSGKLYSDPIGAVIRELSTNAADAMIDAGKGDEPFLVQLPSWMEPTFRVSDNGVGLSEKDVYEIYTVYGESNKTHTDDLTGCLGLGSKSPFAYSDSFTAVSRYNGKKYTYTCFVDEEQIPTIAKLSEEDTDEPNGFEVIIPVEKNDISAFASKAKDILRWFKVKPTVTGQAISFEQPSYIYKTDEYGVYKDRSYNRSGNVVMGNVGYALDASKIDGLDDIGRAILQHGIDIFVTVGEIQFTPNREEMIYSKKTQEAIRRRLATVGDEIKKEIQDKLNSAKTRWEARKIVAGFNHPVVGHVCRNGGVDTEWNGEEVRSIWALTKTIRNSQAAKDLTELKDGEDPSPNPEDMITLYSLNTDYKVCKKYLCYDIQATPEESPDPKVFIFDLGRGNLSRIHWWAQNNHARHMFAFENTKAAKRLLKEEGLDYVLVSSLEEPPKSARNSDGKRTHLSKLNKYINHGTTQEPWEYWQGEDVDVEEGGVYVAISHYQFMIRENDEGEVCKTDKQHPAHLSSLLSAFKDLGDPIDVLYGLRPSDLKTVKKHEDEWSSLQAYIKQVYNKYEEELLPKLKLANAVGRSGNRRLIRLVQARKKWAFGSPLQKYNDLWNEGKEYEKDPKVKAFGRLAGFANPGWWAGHEDSEFDKLIEQIDEEYKILTAFASYSDPEPSILIECIDALDTMKGRKFPPEVTPGQVRLKGEKTEAEAA